MLSGLVGPKPLITLHPYQAIIFLRPPKEYERVVDYAPPLEQTVHGNVTINLPKPRDITSLVVKLVAYYNLAIPNQPPESGVLVEYAQKLSIPSRLEKGEHTFGWSLEIPRTSAPYERCTFGRVYHRLHAIADTSSGTIKEDIPLEIIINPAEEGDTTGLNETIEGFHDAVGPYRLTLTSGHFTVGGVVHFTMNLASVPSELRLRSITAHIIQTFELKSRKTGARETPTPQRRQLFQIDAHSLQRQQSTADPSSPLGSSKFPRLTTVVHSPSSIPPGEHLLGFVRGGDGLELSHVARVPIDDLLRPTTHPESNVLIKVSHKVVINVVFSTSLHSQELALRAERDVSITSCCCTLESLLLPSYSDALDGVTQPDFSPVKDEKTRRQRYNCATECVCGYSLEKLLLKTHAPLLKAHEEMGTIHEPPAGIPSNKIIQLGS